MWMRAQAKDPVPVRPPLKLLQIRSRYFAHLDSLLDRYRITNREFMLEILPYLSEADIDRFDPLRLEQEIHGYLSWRCRMIAR